MAADPRFHPAAGPQSLAAILAAAGATADAPADVTFEGVASLSEAGPREVSFFDRDRMAAALAATRAGAVILRPEAAGRLPPGCIAIRAAHPALAFARVAALFHPAPPPNGIRHPTAVIAATARLAPDVSVGPFAVIGEGAEIGAGSVIHAHAVIGPGVVLGPGSVVHAHASISHAICGARVVLHPGARVGQEGFGFVPDEKGRYVTMPQLGRVILGDDVQVGANACIDRGALEDTVIGPGTRIDNLVQIGHNCRLGEGCILAGQAGLSGSVIAEDRVVLAGQAGIADHVRLGRGARIGAQAGIMSDVPPGTDVIGTPGRPVRSFMREVATLRRLAAAGRPKNEQDRT
ncbi:MAG: UDP-3-O-(3-hydroxymyristoyl)glucosamine N-acyltransferase [Rhodovarius sp.]|nr:UDP-3-O-(3-hydroxymyristoyl)glucosamine N-acyltransferase [Rhodovarius sp.]